MTGGRKLAGMSKEEEEVGGEEEEKGNLTMAGQRTANKEGYNFLVDDIWQTEMIIFTQTDMGWCERSYRNQKSINVVVFASPDRCLSPY